MTEPLPDTWHNRDLPVLRTVVAFFDEHVGEVLRTGAVERATGLTEAQVQIAGVALRDAGLVTVQGVSGLDVVWFSGISAEARRLVGSWPTPDTGADRLIAILEHLAEHAPTEDQRTRARKMLDAAKGAGRDILVGVATGVITGAVQ